MATKAELYSWKIEDARLDPRARLFRECEAMLCYVASRALTPPADLPEKAGLLDVGIESRDRIPMTDLLGLHAMLSATIQPALPGTVELLRWDAANNPRLNFFAPIRAIRLLLVLTVIFFLTFFGTVLSPHVTYDTISEGIFTNRSVGLTPDQARDLAAEAGAATISLQAKLAEAVAAATRAQIARDGLLAAKAALDAAPADGRDPLGKAYDSARIAHDGARTAAQAARKSADDAATDLAAKSRAAAGQVPRDTGQTVLVTLFFISLAGLGSCFSVLYDARRYVVEGTYDGRIGSNYGIRIALGVVSGVLLAQVLTDPRIGDNASGLRIFGLPVLALLGGFGAQLVYTILTRLVAAAESIFDEDRETALKARVQAAQAVAQAQARQERAERGMAVATLAARLDTTETPAERRAVLQQILRAAAGLAEPATATATPADGLLASVSETIGLGRKLVDLLPPDERQEARDTLDSFAERLVSLRALVAAGRGPDRLDAASAIGGTRDQPAMPTPATDPGLRPPRPPQRPGPP